MAAARTAPDPADPGAADRDLTRQHLGLPRFRIGAVRRHGPIAAQARAASSGKVGGSKTSMLTACHAQRRAMPASS
jgi:hypothetical protein